MPNKFVEFSKKSQIEDWLPLLTMIIFLVLLLLFISLSNINKNKKINERIELSILSKDSNQLLLNYLKSQSFVRNQQNENIADELNYYFMTGDENLLGQINTITNDIFSRSHLETDYSSWSLEIKHPDKKELIIESEKSRESHILRKEVSKILIPTYYNDKSIEIKLFFVQTKFVAK